MFQLALPRRERHYILGEHLLDKAVSTRAPAKGATRFNSDDAYIVNVSTRAPAKGATTYLVILGY